jgi:hypothetical protein
MPEKKSTKEDQETKKTVDQPTAQGAESQQPAEGTEALGAQGRTAQVAPLSRPLQEVLRRKLRAKYH